MENGENCESLCKEFKFGTTSEMFIGRLSHYTEFIETMETVLNKYNPDLKLDENEPNNELYMDEWEYPEEFFLDTE